VAVPAHRLDKFVAALQGLEVFVVGTPADGLLTRLEDARPALPETHQTWVRERENGLWRIDLFREPSDDETWVCRRDERIRLPFAEAICALRTAFPTAVPRSRFCTRRSTRAA